jgi:hypothetical protein
MQHSSRMTSAKINAVLVTSSLASRRHFRSLVELQWYSPPKLHELIDFNADQNASYTLVLPVFNQEKIVYDFVKNNDQHACLPYNIIVIFDCCSDKSLTSFMAALQDLKSNLLVQVAVVVTDVPYFETACDNIGFLLSESDFIIETQPDLFIATKDYDRKLLDVLRNQKVSCVSGRCGHSLAELFRFPKIQGMLMKPRVERGRVGLFGTKIETHGLLVDDTSGVAFFCETVNRGPIAFRKNDLVQMDYFDQENFFLGNDEHDFNLRTWLTTGKLPAYLPLKISSKLEWGSTRKKRDPLNQLILDRLKVRPNDSVLKRFKPFYRPYCQPDQFTVG